MNRLEIAGTTQDGCRILEVSGDVDMSSTARLEAAVDDSLGLAPGAALILDLSGVAFLDSSGLRTLLAAHRQAAASGSRLLIVPSPSITRVFELAGITNRIFSVYEDRARALAAGAIAG